MLYLKSIDIRHINTFLSFLYKSSPEKNLQLFHSRKKIFIYYGHLNNAF